MVAFIFERSILAQLMLKYIFEIQNIKFPLIEWHLVVQWGPKVSPHRNFFVLHITKNVEYT